MIFVRFCLLQVIYQTSPREWKKKKEKIKMKERYKNFYYSALHLADSSKEYVHPLTFLISLQTTIASGTENPLPTP